MNSVSLLPLDLYVIETRHETEIKILYKNFK